jgi:hypothetical protein
MTMIVFERYHLAPCGINCGTCRGYLRVRNKCSGCMSVEGSNIRHCINCSIRNCEFLDKTTSKFCYECEKFPCLRIKQIDKRYRIKYKTGLIQNLTTISTTSVETYLQNEVKRWTCSSCGTALSVHEAKCGNCEKEYVDSQFRELIS